MRTIEKEREEHASWFFLKPWCCWDGGYREALAGSLADGLPSIYTQQPPAKLRLTSPLSLDERSRREQDVYIYVFATKKKKRMRGERENVRKGGIPSMSVSGRCHTSHEIHLLRSPASLKLPVCVQNKCKFTDAPTDNAFPSCSLILLSTLTSILLHCSCLYVWARMCVFSFDVTSASQRIRREKERNLGQREVSHEGSHGLRIATRRNAKDRQKRERPHNDLSTNFENPFHFFCMITKQTL